MEFESRELKEATFIAPNSTYVGIDNSGADQLRNDIKISLILKDKKLLKWFEMHSLKQHKSVSGLETLSYLIRNLKEEFVNEHKDDNIKNLTIRKNFDIILSSLDMMIVNKLDVPSEVINTILLSYLSKNFI
jgi:hypothetical protein